ncbi:TlpA disulfide reductase family protein [Pelagibacterium nitratireducens]|uniref:TlpA disulfide reductase family protein n=1 Tax=Pelagibacterium nitratireducens TaxID=1046114 RepID=A0ABZ2HWH9_9HYPH|tara:strand:- start:190 stop:684 length:495 start_codon:yes stop_codon:yes gene_type:complete
MSIFRFLLIAGVMSVPAPAAGQETGVDLSAVTVRDAAGETAALGDLVDGPTIIHFWATWCAPCLEELPQLDAFAQGLEPGELVVVSVDTAGYERIATYLDDLGVGLESYQQIEGNVGGVFAILGYPSTVVVDGEGAVLWRMQGAVDWDDPGITGEIMAPLGALK